MKVSYTSLSTLVSRRSKVYESSAAAVVDIKDGSTVFFGGFGPCGLPENLITAVYNANVKELHCVTNNPGKSVRRQICTFRYCICSSNCFRSRSGRC